MNKVLIFCVGLCMAVAVCRAQEEKPLFTVIGGPDEPVLTATSPGCEDIQGGFEGGACVKVNGVYHLFPTERAGEKGQPAKYDRIKTRIGHWTSKDAIHWKREGTIFQSSGKYAVSHYDNPANDRRAAIWSYYPIFNRAHNRWQGYYLCYTCDSVIAPNHSFGRIWKCESEKEGMDGIDGPYHDLGIVMEPGLDTQLWEGRQGVASFYPYECPDGTWKAFYSGAYPFMSREDYPFGGKEGHWYIALAKSDSLDGVWERMGEDVNPVTSIHPEFVENPIVSRLPDGTYIAVFDGGPADKGFANKIGYTTSKDGLHWSKARYIAIEEKVKKWWITMRTPLCLIPEGNDVYTILYNAITKDRFHPMGMVKVRLNR